MPRAMHIAHNIGVFNLYLYNLYILGIILA